MRIRLPANLLDTVAIPRRRFALSRLSMAVSALMHTAVFAALLQVPGVGDRTVRAAREVLHVVYLGRLEAPKPPPPPPPPPPRIECQPPPETVVAMIQEPPPPLPVAPEPLPPVAVTNPPPVEMALEPPPEPAPEMETRAAPAPEPLAAAPEPVSPPAAVESGDAWDAIRTAIHRQLAYPDSARRRGEEGRVLLLLTVASDGGLEEADAVADGASGRLVTAALYAARRAAPYPAAARGEFRIPVVFRLTPVPGS